MAGKVTRTEANLEDDKNFDTIYKLLIIGDSNVGKTTLLTRFCEGRYQSNFMSTVGKNSFECPVVIYLDYNNSVDEKMGLDTQKIFLAL